ncbi:beta-ketoacyl-[acyl-carrier-protein] synthase family protein [Pseudoalteromonas sp. KG3]|uniref:Beta-ketoacyl-[acyl-carrier-protein] synthase family protein n=1 Tax=Pseudoalteromonas prydzensis TaxID=182141 RepID=A0ABR9FL22_9GAMM|nr:MULTISPECIES: beta-ketoacyl-[acyl-carrier-protein] synthase family protein [Pseudoalteromonas]MBE0457533.1 beta-ketoacyl-[acyl-carrier-protein] synthase family protein [Pseudoalteromonas prydzensis]WKD26130.1 beta-ketoacyl-[acyl-carrier-protein] synthase family protein [Pseudoalteromonas sp. KG3]
MQQPLFISHYAMVNALGRDNQSIKRNLLAGSQAGIVLNDTLFNEGSVYVGAVQGDLPTLTKHATEFQTRNNQLAALALEQLHDPVEALTQQYGAKRIAVIVGTSTSGIAQGEQAIQTYQLQGTFPVEYHYQQQEMDNLAQFIRTELGLQGVALTLSTACSSSAKAFATAQEIISAGLADAAIVGGVDSLCGMTVNGFAALASTSAGVCNPSSRNRDGINLGEAAALCIVQKHGKVKLLAVGESSDAHHMSAPHPQGEGAAVAMRNALAVAGYQACDVDYVNLHGTATPKNDEMEAIAHANVFGLNTPCSSTKGMIGHTLGAAGATEVGLCWLLLGGYDYAPHVWDAQVDESLPAINLVPIGARQKTQITTCLSNSFAFGGNNVSVLIGL